MSQRECDVVEYRAAGHQIEVLKDHADTAANDAEIGVGKRCEVRAVNDDIARGRALEQIDAAHQGGFAGA